MIVFSVPGVNVKATGTLSYDVVALLEDPFVSVGCSKDLWCRCDIISSWRRWTLKGGPILSLCSASIKLKVKVRAPGSGAVLSRPYAAIACLTPLLPAVGASETAQQSSRSSMSHCASSNKHLMPSHFNLDESSRELLYDS